MSVSIRVATAVWRYTTKTDLHFEYYMHDGKVGPYHVRESIAERKSELRVTAGALVSALEAYNGLVAINYSNSDIWIYSADVLYILNVAPIHKVYGRSIPMLKSIPWTLEGQREWMPIGWMKTPDLGINIPQTPNYVCWDPIAKEATAPIGTDEPRLMLPHQNAYFGLLGTDYTTVVFDNNGSPIYK